MAVIMPYGKQQFLDAAGVSLGLGTVTFYVPGTTTPKDTWKDEGRTTLNTNPVALDINGYAIIYGSGSYRQIVKDLLGNTLWDQVVDAFDALATFSGSGGAALIGTSLGETVDAFLTNLVSNAGGASVGTSTGTTVEQRFTGQRLRSVTEFMTSTQFADVTSGTPTLDVSSVFTTALNWCASNNYALLIPKISAKLGAKITSPANVSIYSDPTATLTWTTTASCGWVADGIGLAGNAGYAEIHLPRLVGPNDISGYYLVPPVYDMTTYAGKAFQIKDAIWCKASVQYMIGWGVAFEMITSTQGCDNHNIDLGTVDLCGVGISINSPTGTTHAVGQSQITHRNIFAYTPINMTGQGGGTFQMDIRGTSIFDNQSGGVCYYFTGTLHSNHTIRTGTAENHWAPDSPTGTPTTYRGRMIAGDQTVNGEAGWASGTRLFIDASLPGTLYQAGDAIACKLTGSGSRFTIKAPFTNGLGAVALSTTQGEASYNGGAGGASVYRWTSVSVDCTGLAAGATRTFYFYHQRLNPTDFNPVQISSSPGGTVAGDILVNVLNNNVTVKREAIVQVINRTGSSLTGVYNLLLGVE